MSTIVEKIRKLLELSRSANEHEAALAAEKARELIVKHAVSEDELRAAGGAIEAEPVERDELHTYAKGGWRRGRIPRWHVVLAEALAEAFMCRVFFIPGVEITVIGRASNRQALRYTWLHLRGEIERLADGEWSADHFWLAKANWTRGFCMGAAHTVAERMARSKPELAPTSQTAIVVRNRLQEIEEWIDAAGIKLKDARAAPLPATGYHAGRAAGWGLHLETAEDAQRLAEGPKRLAAGGAR
jgi:hypothetical protein